MPGSRARPDEAVAGALAGLASATRVVLALSGGPDSTALLDLVHRVRPDLDLRAVHVRHRLRDDTADAVAALRSCRALGVPSTIVAVRVAGGGEGLAGEARRARYAALCRETLRLSAALLLVAHTAEDQAETVLLALARGTGVRGLGGMAPSVVLGGVRVCRPLLGVRRGDLPPTALPTVADPSNHDARRRRTVVRSDVLPALALVSGDAVGLVGRAADLARADAGFLDALLEDLGLPRYGPVVCLPRALLEGAPPALAGRLVRLALRRVRGGTSGLGRGDVERVLGLAPGRERTVGGVRVTADGAWLACVDAALPGLPVRALPSGERLDVEELGSDAWCSWWGAPSRTLALRSVATGDRRPDGTRAARELLEAGVPRAARPFVPLVAQGSTVHWSPLDAPGPRMRAQGLRPPVRRDAAHAADGLRRGILGRLAELLGAEEESGAGAGRGY